MIITIDGPVASGKSSVAKALAQKYGLYYLYTGLLYRGAAYLLAKRGIVNPATLTERSRLYLHEADVACLSELTYTYVNGKPAIIIDGQDVTTEIVQTSFDRCASLVSSSPVVREKLLSVQRDIAKKQDIIADGRDCGTVVFPDADYKFYLTARGQERAQRLAVDP
ncbi:MAG: (d)CMP kinase, partial [Candidatus Babeliales bacterium]